MIVGSSGAPVGPDQAGYAPASVGPFPQGTTTAAEYPVAGYPATGFGQLIPGFSRPLPPVGARDVEHYATRQVIAYPGTPSPMFAAIVGAPLEVFSFRYGNPYSPVNEYDTPGRVNDPYAYLNLQWQAPLETFGMEGTVHAAYMDATAAAEMITPQNLSAPTQAYSGQQGYGLP